MTLSKETEVIFDWRRGVEYHSANPPLYDSSTFHQTSLHCRHQIRIKGGIQ
ncbi:aminotransferase class-V family protein [Staphylococcus aureus]|nr:aminotransferase class-V family protein [Staphylococcus aureus]